jgi:hypothetical protein
MLNQLSGSNCKRTGCRDRISLYIYYHVKVLNFFADWVLWKSMQARFAGKWGDWCPTQDVPYDFEAMV